MNISKLNPFNWFRKEEENQGHSLPVRRGDTTPTQVHPLVELHREMDRLFEDFARSFSMTLPNRLFDMPGVTHSSFLRPKLDIAESENQYKITIELPGVTEKDVRVELVGDTLRISGEKRQENEEKDRNYHRIERTYGSFERVLNLPEDADTEHIAATFKNGLMRVTIPRRATVSQPAKQIEVRAA